MIYISYLFLGIIEGITEFLPISSTAHLILISYLLKIPQTEFHKFFEIFIQTGAILAIVFNYFKFILINKNLIKKILVSFIPTAVLSIVFYKLIKNVFFESQLLIILMLIILGVLFILVEFLIKKQKIFLKYDLNNMNYLQAILIGVFQSLAIIPGASRAGAVILGMLILGFKRDSAVLYSFLLAVPTIISAGIYDFYKINTNTQIFLWDSNYIIYLVVGFVSAFISAHLIVKWFLSYLKNNDLSIFGYYRIILGLLFLIILFL